MKMLSNCLQLFSLHFICYHPTYINNLDTYTEFKTAECKPSDKNTRPIKYCFRGIICICALLIRFVCNPSSVNNLFYGGVAIKKYG